MRTSSEKIYDMLIEEGEPNNSPDDIAKIIEEKMEQGFKEIDKKISEAVDKMSSHVKPAEDAGEIESPDKSEETANIEKDEEDHENE